MISAMMNQESITKVPSDYALGWLKASWQDLKTQYFLALAGVIVLALISIVLSLIPLLGGGINGFIGPLVMAGTLSLGKNIVLSSNPQLDNIFHGFRDRDYFNRVIPLCILSGIVGLGAGVPTLLSGLEAFDLLIRLWLSLLSVLLMLVNSLLIPIVLYGNKTLGQSFQLCIDMLSKNTSTLLFLGLWMTLFFLVSVLFCGLPILFILIPMSGCLQYNIYSTIFEGRTLPEEAMR